MSTDSNTIQYGIIYVDDYITDYSDATAGIKAAVNVANSIVTPSVSPNDNRYDQLRRNKNVVLKFSGGKKYRLSETIFLKYGVSIDGGGCRLVPQKKTNGSIGFSQYDGVYYMVMVNVIANDHATATFKWDVEYPAQHGNFIHNINVGRLFYCENKSFKNLGFLLMGAPIIVEDIVSHDICPVVDTLLPDPLCYLDAICIKRIRTNYSLSLFNDTTGVIVRPYVINKRCQGDSMVLDQLVNECGNNEKENSRIIYGIHIVYTHGLTISNSIHADGEMFHCTGVSFYGNHNEKFGLKLYYSNVSIRDCVMHKPGDGPAITIAEFDWGQGQGQRFHTVSLDNVYFTYFNGPGRTYPIGFYPDKYPEILFLGNGTSSIFYRNTQVTTFGPTFSTQSKPSHGITFAIENLEHHVTTYQTAFKDGRIDFIDGVPHYMRGRSIVPPATSMALCEFLIHDTPKDSNNFCYSTFQGVTNCYYYSLYMVNDRYGGLPLGIVLENQSGDQINGINIKAEQILEFCVTPEPIDGCFVIMKRTGGSGTKYVRMPVSRNGYFVDYGDHINGYQWKTDSSILPSWPSSFREGEYIEIDESDRYKLHVKNLLSYLNWTGAQGDQIDIENPLRQCFGQRNVFYLQPFSYLRQTEANRYYHISQGYTQTGVYEDQIYTIRNGKNDSVVEIRISFANTTANLQVCKTVRGTDFITAYIDSSGGLYIKSTLLHCDLSVQTNQSTNLVKFEQSAGNTFPWTTSVGSGWTLIPLTSPNGSAGTSSNRPTNVPVGTCYFDQTLGKPIWLKAISGSTRVWVDAMGNNV